MSIVPSPTWPAGSYQAAAELLSIEDHDVSHAVSVLAALPCEDGLLRRHDDEATRAVLYWVMAGERPALRPELEYLFGAGFCAKSVAKVPSCAAFYVREPDDTRAALREIYDRYGYTACERFRPGCPAVSYVSQQLAFVAHCMETGCYDELSREERGILSHSFFDWAPLFARALVGASTHPAVVFVGIKLQSLLARPH